MGNLRKLPTLDLSHCTNLGNLPDSMVQMVSLKVRLDKSLISSLLNVASLPHFVVHALTGKCSSNVILLQPTNPVKLTIDRLENVKSAKEAQSIKLIEKENIEGLALKWTVAAERFVDDKEVLEKLVPPSSTKQLSLTGYMSVNMPGWLISVNQYLTNLLEIYLYDFANCNNLPPLGHLPKLELLSLCLMEGLEEWNTAYTRANENLFPKLERLKIRQCAKLRIKPCLPRAKSLSIVECDVLLSSWGDSSSHSGAFFSSPITDLTVQNSKVPLHQWRLLHQLPALRSLTISGDCSDLTTSPEIIQHLSSLESLSLRLGWNKKAELRLFELTSFQQSLQLGLCHTKLPSWLVELTSLQVLELFHCESVTSLPQWLGELTSLKKFVIWNCNGISSLPDSIRQLTNLEDLSIRGCPYLEKWCESKENKMMLSLMREVFPRSAKAHEDAASGSRIDNKGKEAVIIEKTNGLTNMKDLGNKLAASIHGTTTGEVHPDLYTAVMNMPGFTEEALSRAVSHLMDNNAQGSAYMGMHEEQRVSWLVNFLGKYY